jgi:hypothetical protein
MIIIFLQYIDIMIKNNKIFVIIMNNLFLFCGAVTKLFLNLTKISD